MMDTLQVQTPTSNYNVKIGSNLLTSIGNELLALGIAAVQPLFIVTDEHVLSLGYAKIVAESCVRAGFSVAMGSVKPGDAHKNLTTAAALYEQLLSAGLYRDGIVIALGGGMVGDLAGFVAATYMRGIPYIQVPTTLLAHDSSIGGKVGVNLEQAKNLVGAFHHPLAVFYDVDTLASLPAREWRGGMAEVIKHAVIGQGELLRQLKLKPVLQFPGAEHSRAIIATAASVKIAVVARDEHESGLRMVLNYGHTIGHAIEKLSNFTINHGEAVAMGMLIENRIAVNRGWLSAETEAEIRDVIEGHRLISELKQFRLEQILEVLRLDKKHRGLKWTFALPRGIGTVQVAEDVEHDEVKTAWDHEVNGRKET